MSRLLPVPKSVGVKHRHPCNVDEISDANVQIYYFQLFTFELILIKKANVFQILDLIEIK